jgi:uncharacterized caspase-like protein/uncharacterized protein YraI
MLGRVLLAVSILLLCAVAANADRRVALVVGNSAYQNAAALPNPRNDSEAMAAKLTEIGFEVILREDLDGQGFRVALGEFSEAALNADIALFFYAGHGIELAGQNYLIPVDAKMRSEATAQFEAVPLEQVLSAVRSAKKLGMVMLDACRDNPFAASMTRSNGTRSISRGLAPVSVEGEKGLLISFAAEAGRTAEDGDATHSPYTEALLETIGQPGLEIGRIFRTVRAKVRDASGGRQVPIEQAQLPDEDLYLVSGDAAPVSPTPTPTPAPAPAAQEDPLLIYLDAVQKQDRAALEDFVRRYPEHPRAKDARALITAMAEKSAWDAASASDSEDGYRNFLAAFPDSPHAVAAQMRLVARVPVPVPVPQPTPQPIPTPPSTTGYSCPAANGPVSVVGIASNDTLFLRSGPSSSTKQIGSLAFNSDGISVAGCSANWCQVQQGCLSGYAFQKYLTADAMGNRASRYTGIYDVTNHPASELLNVRSGPGTTFQIVSGLPYNATGLEVIDCQKNAKEQYFWCYLRWNDVSGWAYSRYLTRVQ